MPEYQPDQTSEIAIAIERSRQELLDLGLRGNSLLHFRVNRADSVLIFDEISEEIFKILVEGQRKMSFLPLPKNLQTHTEEEGELLPEIIEEHLDENRHTDTRLQTRMSAEQLDKRLLRINSDAESYFQEQGIDILYLALGFLRWYEDKNSDLERLAPLVLIPVSLERRTASERFKVQYTQVDLGTNLTLKAKLKMDFDMELPEFDEEKGIAAYFKAVRKAIKKEDRWEVLDNEIHLGFFKFGKFQMYQDLDATKWPEGNKPADHPILKSLFGEGFGAMSESEVMDLSDDPINESLQKLDSFHFITDADSSQTEAILKIKQGHNLVIQGPPGTGKSQTITNIISECLADDKKILFVSEKMVALEVVKNRLDKCHLGDAVLELHSHKSNKKAVLQELGRTMELGKPKIEDRALQYGRYTEVRDRLDTYVKEIKDPIRNSGVDFVTAVGLATEHKYQLDANDISPISFDHTLDWDVKKYQEALRVVSDLVAHIKEHGIPSKNPYAGATISNFSPAQTDDLNAKLDGLLLSYSKLKELLSTIPLESVMSGVSNLNDVSKLQKGLGYLALKPKLEGVDVHSNLWQTKRDAIASLIANGVKQDQLHKEYKVKFTEAAFDQDWSGIRHTLVSKGSSFFRFLSGDYNKAKKYLKGYLRVKLPKHEECVTWVDAMIDFKEASNYLESNNDLGAKLFGDHWLGSDKNWQEIDSMGRWLLGFYERVHTDEIPNSFVEVLNRLPDGQDWGRFAQKLSEVLSEIQSQTQKLNALLGITEDDSKEIELGEVTSRLKLRRSNQSALFTQTRYNHILLELGSHGLKTIADISYNWKHSPELLSDLFNYGYYNALVNYAYSERESIKHFDKVAHEKIIEEFRDLDLRLSHFAQEKLTLKHYQKIPHFGAVGEMAIIRREINKKRRHMPIRQLLKKAGHAVQQIKPVFMMSPMSVATFIAPGRLTFDIVIFDEASQIKVVDAMIPILRGKQVVVVGDSKQMPPTDFFERSFEYDEEEEETMTGDIESILSMFLAQGARESMLRWHYRSRHDSLINVSNQEFYEGKLMVFPSSGTDERARGLHFNHIPESHYERGASRTNPIEARKVAEAVMEHAQKYPDLSLGVVAFSTAQRDRIILEMERLRRTNEALEPFFSSTNPEPFFVKNLENVQGDERDVIFISIGYGRTENGRLPKNFGPVNREGGERRLNVLITRARLAMEVFCNFTADDLETSAGSPFGVRALKSFIRFAEKGHLENRFETGNETDSPFEDQVIRAIQNLGYDVEAQVGSAGFFIDIAVKDPNKPGRYVLAVECDGASYHSSATARDRDRLRQSVLEEMGWEFHRIWSTDWFRDSKSQTENIKIAIENAIRKSENGDGKPNGSNSTSNVSKATVKRVKVEQMKPKINKYNLSIGKVRMGRLKDIKEMDDIELVELAQRIIAIEGALHIKELAKRMVDCLGIGRVGNRIFEQIENAIKRGMRWTEICYSQDFVYPDKQMSVALRNRTDLDNTYKNIEWVPSGEIQIALVETVRSGFTIAEDEAISEALSLLGFNRATEKITKIMKGEIRKLLRSKKLVKEEGHLVLPKD